MSSALLKSLSRETPLLQVRSFPIMLKNTGKVILQFGLELADDDLVPNPAMMPFTVTPSAGTVPPGESLEIIVKFAPTAVRDYDATLTCTVQNVQAESAKTQIHVYGSSIRPLCHLELGEGQTEDGFKVLEFLACGVGSTVTRKIPVINPTDGEYSFKWLESKSTAKTAAVEPFKCLTPSGTIPAGKQVEMVFQFLSDSIRTIEQIWTLHVDEHKLTVPLQLVGRAREPRVNLSKTAVTFGSIAAGFPAVTSLEIVNDETETFTFAFDEQQIANINSAALFTIEPVSGKVNAHGRTKINVKFVPSIAQPYDLAISCAVKKKTVALALHIQAQVFAVQSSIVVDAPSSEGPQTQLVAGTSNSLDLGSTYVFDRVARTLFVCNNGHLPIAFDWRLDSSSSRRGVTVEPLKGSVLPQSKTAVTLAFLSETPLSFADSLIACHIEQGPVYQLGIAAKAVEPAVSLSKAIVDFDKVFVANQAMAPYEQRVIISNNDKEAVSVRCLYTSNPNMSVSCPTSLLPAGGSHDAKIVFTPRSPGNYNETVHFEINSRTKVTLKVTAVAVPLRLQLEKPADRVIAFGAVAQGSSVEKVANLVNLSALPVNVLLTADVQALVDHCLSIHPGNAVLIPPKGTCPISIKFSPEGRIELFSEEIAVQCLNQIEPLLHVTGCCQAVQVELDIAQLPFGMVAVNSQATRRVLIANTGDIGARFKWQTEQLGEWFSISPKEGYISPGHEVALSVTFHPKFVKTDVRVEGIKCMIENSTPLELDVSGSSVAQQAEKEPVIFSTIVRQPEVKQVRIFNPTSYAWNLKPVFESDFFSGAETFAVEPNQFRMYDITYLPLTMTVVPRSTTDKKDEHRPHTETLFIALPDGNALLFNLIGTAYPARPIPLPSREVPCKLWYTESISVQNWLKKPQRFRVLIIKTKADASTIIKGLDYLDVPAGGSKDFKLQFFSYREGVTSAEIVFRNESTQEFVSYECTFKSTPPGTMDTVHLTSVVRQALSHTITLDNPLSAPVTFAMSCVCLDGSRTVCTEIHAPSSLRVPAKSESAEFTFEFLPVRAREFSARLSLTSQELGVFQYDLVLTGTPAPPLPMERFRTTLGETVVRRFRFTNFNTLRGDYSIACDAPEFSAPGQITTAAAVVKVGSEVSFDITYEPTRLGDCRGTMIISSPIGGEYVCPLSGQCLPPKPSGPHTVRNGDKLKISFKNVFNTSETFSYSCDNAGFTVKPMDSFRPKESKDIIVKYDGQRDEVTSCKLIVVCTTGSAAGTEWIFYLKGVAS